MHLQMLDFPTRTIQTQSAPENAGTKQLGAHIGAPGDYYMSVTAHGVAMAYVLSTFFIMGFGYFVAVTALNRPLPGLIWAWGAFWMGILGVVLAVASIG